MGFRRSAIAIALIVAGAGSTLAQETQTAQEHQHSATGRSVSNTGALLNTVRSATERFKDVNAAVAEGYVLQFGCVTGSDSGAMGMHYVNGALVASGVLDPMHPQIVIYEPQPDGTLQLIGADYLVIADVWNKSHSGPPEMMGQLFHLFDAPNRFGLPAFYTLHVWAWKDNPNGAFVNWHPNVSCDAFGGQK
jgi:hypothetical protein